MVIINHKIVLAFLIFIKYGGLRCITARLLHAEYSNQSR